jgi:hypothetical protein
MTSRAEYTYDEWALLYTAPIIVALAVSYAEPGGVASEMISAVLMEGMVGQRFPGNELLGALWTTKGGTPPAVSSPTHLEPDHLKEQTLEQALDTCRKVVAILDERSNAKEAGEYRQFLGEIAVAAAEAARSGGFFGIGGVLVTPAERAAVDEIRDALGLEPMSAGEGARQPPEPDSLPGIPGAPSGSIDPS